MVYSRGRVLDRGGLEIRHRGSSEARGEDTDESGDSAEREQIGGLYLLDIGGHELLVVYGCEINSCFNNYFEARGSKLRINIFKLFKNKSGDVIEPENRDE